MVLTAAMIASATGGYIRAGAPDRAIDGFAIDSRTLQPGDLFFAIVAARDGHEFVSDALARGAIGAVVSPLDRVSNGGPGFSPAASPTPGPAEAGPSIPADPILIEVADTTAALQDLARFVRRESSATVIAITGSAGKTTTKETIAALLESRYQLAKNKGNLNNHLGLPLSLLELRRGADVAVMELGMNHAGELRLLVGIAEPEIRVWTNVGDAHLGYFASRASPCGREGRDPRERFGSRRHRHQRRRPAGRWRAQQASRDARLRLERRRTRMSAPTPLRTSGSTACASVSTPPTGRRRRRSP